MPTARLSELDAQGAVLAFWRSDATGESVNGGKRGGGKRKVGTVETAPGPLKPCSSHALHGSLAPNQWSGSRLWVVALYPPVDDLGDKLASLKREILAEITPNPFER